MLVSIDFQRLTQGEKAVLKTFAVAILAIGMSAGLAEAKGHAAKPKALPYCEMEQQTKATCSCGPGNVMCPKGMWCHTFTSTCTK
jgi:hypothetical protein